MRRLFGVYAGDAFSVDLTLTLSGALALVRLLPLVLDRYRLLPLVPTSPISRL